MFLRICVLMTGSARTADRLTYLLTFCLGIGERARRIRPGASTTFFLRPIYSRYVPQ